MENRAHAAWQMQIVSQCSKIWIEIAIYMNYLEEKVIKVDSMAQQNSASLRSVWLTELTDQWGSYELQIDGFRNSFALWSEVGDKGIFWLSIWMLY